VSRIGKLPVTIPTGVKVAIDSNALRLVGPKGKLQTEIPTGVGVKVEGNVLHVERQAEDRKVRALHGLSTINAMWDTCLTAKGYRLN